MDVMLGGMHNEVRLVQFSNAYASIRVTLLGKETDLSPLQFLKARSVMELISSPITIYFKFFCEYSERFG